MDGFGERLRAAREAAGITRKQMCADLGISTVSLARYETDAREPDMTRLRDIAAYLHINLDDLLDYRPGITPIRGVAARYFKRLLSAGYNCDILEDNTVTVYKEAPDGTELYAPYESMADFVEAMRRADRQARDGIDALINAKWLQAAQSELLYAALRASNLERYGWAGLPKVPPTDNNKS